MVLPPKRKPNVPVAAPPAASPGALGAAVAPPAADPSAIIGGGSPLIADPRMRAFLMQAAVSLLRGTQPGESELGSFGRAISQGGAAVGRVEEQARKDAQEKLLNEQKQQQIDIQQQQADQGERRLDQGERELDLSQRQLDQTAADAEADRRSRESLVNRQLANDRAMLSQRLEAQRGIAASAQDQKLLEMALEATAVNEENMTIAGATPLAIMMAKQDALTQAEDLYLRWTRLRDIIGDPEQVTGQDIQDAFNSPQGVANPARIAQTLAAVGVDPELIRKFTPQGVELPENQTSNQASANSQALAATGTASTPESANLASNDPLRQVGQKFVQRRRHPRSTELTNDTTTKDVFAAFPENLGDIPDDTFLMFIDHPSLKRLLNQRFDSGEVRERLDLLRPNERRN